MYKIGAIKVLMCNVSVALAIAENLAVGFCFFQQFFSVEITTAAAVDLASFQDLKQRVWAIE